MMAEDGEGEQHLVGPDRRGRRSRSPATTTPNDTEFTGPTFSPDRRTLFANIQEPGLRLRDPWSLQEASVAR